MTMVMISPPGGKFPWQTARLSPRLVPPRFRLVAGVSSESLLMIFPNERLHIAEDGHRRATRGPTRKGAPRGGAPHPRDQGVAPLGELFFSIFIIFQNNFRGVSGLLELCRIGL